MRGIVKTAGVLVTLSVLMAGTTCAQTLSPKPPLIITQPPGQMPAANAPIPKLPPGVTAAQYRQLLAAQAQASAARLDRGADAVLAALREVKGGSLTLMGGADTGPLLPDLQKLVRAGTGLSTLLAPEAPDLLRTLTTGRRVALRVNTGVTVITTPTALIIVGKGRQEVYHSLSIVAAVNASLNRALTPPPR